MLGAEPEWVGLGWYVADWAIFFAIGVVVLYLDGLGRRLHWPNAVFLSYRRGDSENDVDRVYQALRKSFGASQVFRDIAALEPGADFKQQIEQTIPRCRVLVALIGPHWLDDVRLNDPADFVRMELELARASNVPVVPVLTGGAKMPNAENLPPSLAWLPSLHAVNLSDASKHALKKLTVAVRRWRRPPPSK